MIILAPNKKKEKTKQIAIIQEGKDNNFDQQIVDFKNEYENKGYKVHWYVYDGDMETERFLNEIIDTKPFYDYVMVVGEFATMENIIRIENVLNR